MNMSDAEAVLIAYILADIPAFLEGAPGIGKSEMVASVAKKTGRRLFDFRAALKEPVDVRGLPVPDLAANLTRWLAPNDLPFVGSYSPDDLPPLIFLDEITQASPMMEGALLGVIQERKAGDHILDPRSAIVAAGNRMSDRAGGRKMGSAMANRLATIHCEPNFEAWCNWAVSANIHPLMIAFIRFRPDVLHIMPGKDETAFPTPRSLTKTARLLPLNLPDKVRLQAITGLIGSNVAGELEAFIRVWRDLPKKADVIADPQGAKCPTREQPAVCFAVSGMLARAADRQNFEPILSYGRRLPAEHGARLFHDAVRRDPTLNETRAGIAYRAANNALLT